MLGLFYGICLRSLLKSAFTPFPSLFVVGGWGMCDEGWDCVDEGKILRRCIALRNAGLLIGGDVAIFYQFYFGMIFPFPFNHLDSQPKFLDVSRRYLDTSCIVWTMRQIECLKAGRMVLKYWGFPTTSGYRHPGGGDALQFLVLLHTIHTYQEQRIREVYQQSVLARLGTCWCRIFRTVWSKGIAYTVAVFTWGYVQ